MRFLIKKAWKQIGESGKTPLKVVFADGTSYANSRRKPKAIVTYRNRKAEWYSALFGSVGLAESYIYGDLDIEGDIIALVLLGDAAAKGKRNFFNPLNVVRNRWHEFLYGNRSLRQAKRNALSHYNRGTEMFRQYLDPTMTYTCAYWKEGTKTLEKAQRDKVDHTLRKLRLKRGETLVDVGSGWGSVLFRACEKYGVIGTNVSPTPDQNEAMRSEIEKRGYKGKINIKEIDFREDDGMYDRYISLGVYEHAGKGQLEDWIRVMARSLKPGGLGVLHFIGNVRSGLEGTGIFIRKHIFPGGYLPGLSETLEIMGRHGLEILDVENLRRHYARTLECWARNFDRNWKKIHALDPKKFDEQFRRRWRFYLYGCSAFFLRKHTTDVGLFQITFSKGKGHDYPMTREFLYRQ